MNSSSSASTTAPSSSKISLRSVDDIEARLANVHAGHRTALLDAIYFGMDKMKPREIERKALLVVSDGGDNRTRYTEGEVRAQVRESDVKSTPSASSTPTPPPPKSAWAPCCSTTSAKKPAAACSASTT